MWIRKKVEMFKKEVEYLLKLKKCSDNATKFCKSRENVALWRYVNFFI